MKIKEQVYVDYCRENPTEKVVYKHFIAGFEAGTPKWINIEDELPEDDKTVVCWADNTENPLYSELKLGSFIDGTWYCKGGRNSQEIITKWHKIAE